MKLLTVTQLLMLTGIFVITSCNDNTDQSRSTKEEIQKVDNSANDEEKSSAEADTDGDAGQLKGSWWYTSTTSSNGEVYKLQSRQSVLEIKDNNDFYQNTWMGGINNMSSDGKYFIDGNKITLQKNGGNKEEFTYTLDAEGKLLTLVAEDGSGSTLERK